MANLEEEVISNSKHILVVDDEECILKSLSNSLKLMNDSYLVKTASSAEEALSYIENNPVDLLITDLMLPKMNGLELTANMRAVHPRVNSILVTAYGNDEIFESAKKNGCIALLGKPFNLTELVTHINSAFDSRGKFRVSLPEITLPDLIHLYKRNKGSAVLSIVADNSAGMMVIDNGMITHVRLDEHEGPHALLDILDIKTGSINALSNSAAPKKRTVSVSAECLEAAADSQHPEDILGIERTCETQDSEETIETGLSGLISGEMLQGYSEDIMSTLEEILAERGYIPSLEPRMTDLISEDNGPAKNLKDFTKEDLILNPEPEQLILYYSPQKQAEMARIKELIDEGIEKFKAQNLSEARDAWEKALSIDSKCEDARRNLNILSQVETSLK